MIRAIALDDEPLALEVIQHYCERIEFVSLEKVFNKQSDAVKYLNKFPVDLILLDIEMPNANGIDLYRSLSQDTKVIFTTAYSEYAVDAFEVNAIDYLVKPFSFDRFKKAVDKVKQPLVQTPENDYLFIRANYKLHKIDFNEIVMIESLDDYIRIYLENNENIVARHSLKELLTKLPESLFVRIHRSYIIPFKKIKSIGNSTLQIRTFVLPIGESYKDALIKLI